MSESVKEHKAAAPSALGLAIVTVSDSRNLETDSSGKLIAEMASQAGHQIQWRMIIHDEPVQIRKAVDRASADSNVQAVIFTGGTGISPRDQTVETLEKCFTRRIPGFGELFRMLSYQEIGSATILSRSTAGLINHLVVALLPGSRAAVRLAMEKILIPELGHLVREANK
ncbi:MAG: hypothetical protein RJA81_1989 [Planctomycetota bacterium]|jgi:molybdenum cofactor biosynthesis protein B